MNIFFISNGDTINKPSCITPWSFIHLYSGFIFYLTMKLLFPKLTFINILISWIIIHTLYEIKDILYYFKIKLASDYWGNNSIMNSLFDTIFALIGLYIGYIINSKSILLYIISIIIYFLFLYYFTTFKFG